MEIDKAIEILGTFTFASKTIPRNDVNDTVKLGIEALKQIKYLREIHILYEDELLPGETKT